MVALKSNLFFPPTKTAEIIILLFAPEIIYRNNY